MSTIDLDAEQPVIIDDSVFAELCLRKTEGLADLLRYLSVEEVRLHPSTELSVLNLAYIANTLPLFRKHMDSFLWEVESGLRYIGHKGTWDQLGVLCHCTSDEVLPSSLIPIACATAFGLSGSAVYVATLTPETYTAYSLPNGFNASLLIDCRAAFA